MRPANLIIKRRVPVLGRTMSCVDEGSGDPIVFLHGNPTSSYLWRNVWPHLAGRGRIIVPDLIGMGDSDKLPVGEPDRYRFVCHSRYLDALLTALGVRDRVVLVLHDWGGALGFDWANRNRSAVRALAYTETFVRPLGWSDLPESFRPTLRAVRSPDGERMVLGENMFIEKMLPGVTQRRLTEAEMAEYRRPFLEPGDSRLATLVWPREVPLDGQPADVAARIAAYSEWLATSPIPKLFINANPGVFIQGGTREFCRSWPNQTEVAVPGMHFVQEDSPELVGQALAGWYGTLS